MKSGNLKKNTFIQGAFIATLGIVITKIIGIIYVIPFYSIIGIQGGALYGYAYNIYTLFLGISCGGIPFAISKIISEYNELGYYKAKEKVFILGKRILALFGVISFIIVFLFADIFATLIIRGITGGNSVRDVAYVIRMISFALLIVPILSIYRGYLQGHKFITPISISQVIEQIVRVFLIIFGSYYFISILKMDIKTTIGFAVFCTFVGALASYFYLLVKTLKNKKQLTKRTLQTDEPLIRNKQIVKKIIYYALPFAMVEIFRSLYDLIDVFLLVDILVKKIGYSMKDAEEIVSVFSAWGLKLNMIITSISSGVMVSFIPNISSSFVKGDLADVRHKINKVLQVLLYFVIPMTVGLSILAKPVWTCFYGYSKYGSSVYSFYVFMALFLTIFTALQVTIQMLKEYKILLRILLCSFFTNLFLTIPFIYAFNKIGFKPYFGAIFASILGLIVAIVISLLFLHKKYKVDFSDTFKKIGNIISSTLVMTISLLLLQFILPFTSTSRLMNVIHIVIYTLIGGSLYLILTTKNNLFKKIYGFNISDKIRIRK